jgi:hypothetical protein
MQVKNDDNLDQVLEINIELKKGIDTHLSDNITKDIQKSILEALLSENSEFRIIYFSKGQEKPDPKIKLWPNGYQEFFSTGGKHKWVNKN